MAIMHLWRARLALTSWRSPADDDGAATWCRIMAAVEQLANKTPPGRVN